MSLLALIVLVLMINRAHLDAKSPGKPGLRAKANPRAGMAAESKALRPA
jgi:hypothetical protein